MIDKKIKCANKISFPAQISFNWNKAFSRRKLNIFNAVETFVLNKLT